MHFFYQGVKVFKEALYGFCHPVHIGFGSEGYGFGRFCYPLLGNRTVCFRLLHIFAAKHAGYGDA